MKGCVEQFNGALYCPLSSDRPINRLTQVEWNARFAKYPTDETVILPFEMKERRKLS